MADNMNGADPGDLRDLASSMIQSAEALAQIRARLSARITEELRWYGPDAFVFRHAWMSSYAPVLGRTSDMLHLAAGRLREQAAEQERTSSV
ncbi:hypothetical protein [Arthrobacter sp. 35W]|uniref:hypothetical protein n=1 Tax=Arthrobacter sp. 35W TaxID=1132441 RepID=UPI0004189692|nr:hypothetical protein [Arthrobacter sp. 35W]